MQGPLVLLYWTPELVFFVGGLFLPWLLMYRLGITEPARRLAAFSVSMGLVDLAIKGLVIPLVKLLFRLEIIPLASASGMLVFYLFLAGSLVLLNRPAARAVIEAIPAFRALTNPPGERTLRLGVVALGAVYLAIAVFALL